MERLLESENDHELFTLIAMDQRYSHVDDDDANDGSLSCNLADDHNVDWTTFRDDQLALLDHLRINKPCHIVGSCIGPSYALQLLRDAPSRFAKAVLLQPIGVAKHTTEEVETWDGLNAGAESHWFGVWANAMLASGQVSSRKVLDRMYDNMFGSKAPSRDFVFTISREEMRRINHNLLVFCGIDMFHPAEIAREICRLAPNASEVVERWRNDGSERLEEAHGLIRSFLQE